jgi:hypothetical protein
MGKGCAPCLRACLSFLQHQPVGLLVKLKNELSVRAVAVHIVLDVLPTAFGHFVEIEPVAVGVPTSIVLEQRL